jgi:oxepin-CoA hydrolase/3-oxo-5,6-dehydrosuberyl-CoA semialdehyde dehydrogenase
LITHGRTITESDIVQFANVSWDHFYAHTDVTTLEGTIFTQRVAHGYFVLSMAAGLFVDPGKGPVLLNYGLEECRFTKPVYAGMTLSVRLTVKEKTACRSQDR